MTSTGRRAAAPRTCSLTLADLVPDEANARAHSARGVGLIETSLGRVGAARSIVVDEHNRVLAGNATIEAAARVGIERVIVVDTDGEALVAVRRSGLSETQKTELALFDNRAPELSGWDAGVLADLAAAGEVDLSSLWREEELAAVLAGVREVEPVMVLGDGDDNSSRVGASPWSRVIAAGDRTICMIGDVEISVSTDIYSAWLSRLEAEMRTAIDDGGRAATRRTLTAWLETAMRS